MYKFTRSRVQNIHRFPCIPLESNSLRPPPPSNTIKQSLVYSPLEYTFDQPRVGSKSLADCSPCEREPGHDGRRGEEPLNRASYSELFPSHGRKNGGGRARRLERSMHSIESSKESRYARLDDALKGIPKLGHPVSN